MRHHSGRGGAARAPPGQFPVLGPRSPWIPPGFYGPALLVPESFRPSAVPYRLVRKSRRASAVPSRLAVSSAWASAAPYRLVTSSVLEVSVVLTVLRPPPIVTTLSVTFPTSTFPTELDRPAR